MPVITKPPPIVERKYQLEDLVAALPTSTQGGSVARPTTSLIRLSI